MAELPTTDPPPPVLPPVWSNRNQHPVRTFLIASVLFLVVLGLLVTFFDDPLAIPTTSETVVSQDLAALRPLGATIVKGPSSHSWDCGDGPAEAWMTLRFTGVRDHAELEMRRLASRAGWLVDPTTETRRRGADLGSFYRSSHTAGSVSFFVNFTTHGSFTDARVKTVGQLGQKCGVD